jgi:hypothetical protein
MADSADLDLATPVDFDDEIDKLCNLSVEDLKRRGLSSREEWNQLSSHQFCCIQLKTAFSV